MAASKPTITVGQHFVPELLLRNFAVPSSTEQINAYRIPEGKFIPKTGIKGQGKQRHFYGEQAIEKWLGTIESATGPILRAAIQNESLPSQVTAEYHDLLKFAFLQSTRTPFAADEVHAMGQALEERAKQMGIALPDGEPINAPALAMAATLRALHITEDLGCKLLCNRTRQPFLLSDHPAVRYNHFLEQCGRRDGTTGTAVRGLQLFLPIGPRHTLIFYDLDVYKVGGRKPNSIRVEVTDEKDVFALNLLQAVNADECLYFNHEVTEEAVRKLLRKAERHRQQARAVSRVYEPADQFNGQQGVLIEVRRPDQAIGLQLRCVSVAPHATKYNPGNGPIPYRNPMAVAALELENGIPPIQSGVFAPNGDWNGHFPNRKGSNTSRR